MADIFLSCESKDRQRVAPIAALLESCGWSVWWGQQSDAGGSQAIIERELSACRCVLVAWSTDAVDSSAVQFVAGRGLARGILVSVSIDFSRPPPELEGSPSLAFAGWTGDASSPRAKELLDAVGGLLRPPLARHPPGSDLPASIRAAGPARAEVEVHLAHAEIGAGPDVGEDAGEQAWAAPDEAEEELRLPPVLLRDVVQPPQPPDAPQKPLAPRSLRVGLIAGLAIAIAAATFWKTGWPGGSERGGELAPVNPAPESAPKLVAAPTPASLPKRGETKPTPVASPPPGVPGPTPAAPSSKALEIEDLLTQVTPRVEQILASARRLIRIGDIRSAREVLEAPETAHSALLTLLLAETYDPNVLPAPLKGVMADPDRARALYRKARELGDDRAQGRLDALKTSDCSAFPARSPAAHSACPPGRRLSG